jgi:hypothetical protein
MTERTFAGLPIAGEANKSRRGAVHQKSLEEFQTLVMETLNAPGIEALRFRPYTPYFNDGEPCEFAVHGEDGFVKPMGGDENAGDYEDGFIGTWDVELKGGEETTYSYDYATRHGAYTPTGKVFERHPSFEQIEKFKEIFKGCYDDVIYDLFGDHCQVTISPSGIVIDEYEHD